MDSYSDDTLNLAFDAIELAAEKLGIDASKLVEDGADYQIMLEDVCFEIENNDDGSGSYKNVQRMTREAVSVALQHLPDVPRS